MLLSSHKIPSAIFDSRHSRSRIAVRLAMKFGAPLLDRLSAKF
ncbi:hypothetical protein [uncultured Campylobacter sp.]|nr:hypothetical protein [uncultured Campylobacter sp.]